MFRSTVTKTKQTKVNNVDKCSALCHWVKGLFFFPKMEGKQVKFK